jgi:hypothetical protein
MNYKIFITMAVSAILIVMVFSGANILYPGHNPTNKLIIGGHSGSTHPSISDQNFTLTGNISDIYNKLPVHGTILIKNSTMSTELNYSQNGTYSTTLPGEIIQ